MTIEKQTFEIYNSWYSNNRKPIEEGEWKLVDPEILHNPEKDTLKGLNLISFLAAEINDAIDSELVPAISEAVGEAGWFLPRNARHVTLLDILPHNSGVSIEAQKELSSNYRDIIQQVLSEFKKPIKIVLRGVFASPDGITIQGFPVNESLHEFRQTLRQGFHKSGVANMEAKKYPIETAHVALVKFVAPLDGKKLLQVIDAHRDVEIGGEFELTSGVLNISSRYDKAKTIEVIEEFHL